MKIIDISQTIYHKMPTYPTDPLVRIEQFKSLEKGNSCNLSKLQLGTHSGTHLDTQLHIFNKGQGVDELNLEDLICPAQVVNLKDLADMKLNIDTKSVLVKGGTINLEQAQKLVKKSIRSIGVEEQSVENSEDKNHPVHRLLLSKGVIIIENLELSRVKTGCYQLICLPLKIKNGDGAPCRAILIYD